MDSGRMYVLDNEGKMVGIHNPILKYEVDVDCSSKELRRNSLTVTQAGLENTSNLVAEK